METDESKGCFKSEVGCMDESSNPLRGGFEYRYTTVLRGGEGLVEMDMDDPALRTVSLLRMRSTSAEKQYIVVVHSVTMPLYLKSALRNTPSCMAVKPRYCQPGTFPPRPIARAPISSLNTRVPVLSMHPPRHRYSPCIRRARANASRTLATRSLGLK